MAKYIRIWEGIIESGRDQGYPETKSRIYSSAEDLVRDNNRKGIVYKLVNLTEEDVLEIELTKEKTIKGEKEKKIKKLQDQANALISEINRLKRG